ncbi:MAG: hypothetical protein AAGI48_08790 [Verrucomicrobiota bacterium]
MGSEGKREVADVAATGGAALVLLGAGFWNLMSVLGIPRIREMFADMGSAELPVISRLVFQLSELYVFHIISLVLLLLGFAALFATRDRARGILYSLVVSILIFLFSLVIKEAATMPIYKIMQMINQ